MKRYSVSGVLPIAAIGRRTLGTATTQKHRMDDGRRCPHVRVQCLADGGPITVVVPIDAIEEEGDAA